MELREFIRRAVETGQQKGFVTFDELNELAPEKFEPEDIETLLEALNAEGIQLIE